MSSACRAATEPEGAIFDLDAWLDRIGYSGARTPDLATLRGIVIAQVTTIPFENIDVLLGRPPRLDPDSLQRKLVAARRGGYCFELNLLLRAGLRALGFDVQGRIAHVIRHLDPDSERPASHAVLQVTLAEGVFMVDVGFGGLTPTAPLLREAGIAQPTPHETMRLMPYAGDLVLQAQRGGAWENIWRLCEALPRDIDYEVANWFTATNPASPFVTNLTVSRPDAHGQRHTLLNGRISTRTAAQAGTSRMLDGGGELAQALAETFGLVAGEADIGAVLATLDRLGRSGAPHAFFT